MQKQVLRSTRACVAQQPCAWLNCSTNCWDAVCVQGTGDRNCAAAKGVRMCTHLPQQPRQQVAVEGAWQAEQLRAPAGRQQAAKDVLCHALRCVQALARACASTHLVGIFRNTARSRD